MCTLGADVRRTFIEQFEKRLATRFSPDGTEPLSYREFMGRQARSIAYLVAGQMGLYRPLRVHS
jgi:hypothetical protein